MSDAAVDEPVEQVESLPDDGTSAPVPEEAIVFQGSDNELWYYRIVHPETPDHVLLQGGGVFTREEVEDLVSKSFDDLKVSVGRKSKTHL